MTRTELAEKQLKLCECGCGQPAPIAKNTITARGYKKGEQTRFIRGHHVRFIKRSYPIGEKANNWRGGKLKIKCVQCEKDFYKKPDQIKRAKNNFCSHECHSNWRKSNMDGKNNPNWKGGSQKVYCYQCGKQFKKRLYAIKDTRKNFCSKKCQGIWTSFNQSGKGNPRWLGGIACRGYCQTWNDKEFKNYIFDRDEHKCQNPDCWGINDKLCRHHVDYDKKNCTPDNVILLCNSCNPRANTNREWHTAYYQAIILKKKQLSERINDKN